MHAWDVVAARALPVRMRSRAASQAALLWLVVVASTATDETELQSLPARCRASLYPRVDVAEDLASFSRDLIDALRSAPLGGTKCLKRVLPCVSQRGLWLEFGVFQGKTIRQISSMRRPGAAVIGFDSFRGLPEDWRRSNDSAIAPFVGQGAFDLGGVPPFVETVRIKWRVGPFDRSIPKFLEEPRLRERPLAMVHVDCDLYSATNTVLTLLADRLVPGVVLVFDELVFLARVSFGAVGGSHLGLRSIIRSGNLGKRRPSGNSS